MSQLFLVEVPVGKDASLATVQPVIDSLHAVAKQASGDLIEVQYGRDLGLVYGIFEHRMAEVLEGLLRAANIEFTEVVPVQLVGPTLEEVKAHRGAANYLVEWDIPEEIGLEQYLASKKAKAPLYAKVPETTFMRTYVREDAVKCLCLYDAPDEDAVRRAREAVNTPIDRLTRIGE
jgi:Protein of unknown function (DUF4242)